jgi:hypothetical protein
MHYAAKKALGHHIYKMAPCTAPLYYRSYITDKGKRVNTRLNTRPQFEAGNVVRTRYTIARVVVEQRGQYLKLQYLEEHVTYWAHCALYEFVAVDQREYEFQQQIKQLEYERDQAISKAELQTKRELVELSQNTVTRALVHAHDNGYCSETAVALISAGHKLPDVDLSVSFNVSMSVHLEGNKSYYLLRELFGRTKGDLSTVGSVIDSLGYDAADKLDDMIRQQLDTSDISINTLRVSRANATFHQPVLRTVDTTQANLEYESSLSND